MREYVHLFDLMIILVGFFRVWFFMFSTSIAFCAVITDYMSIYMLHTQGWDWLVLIGCIEAIFFSVIACLVFIFSVRHFKTMKSPVVRSQSSICLQQVCIQKAFNLIPIFVGLLSSFYPSPSCEHVEIVYIDHIPILFFV